MQNRKSPVVPIISNGVLIWASIIAHYCTLLGSFPLLIQRLYSSCVFFYKAVLLGEACANCLLWFPERKIFLKTEIFLTLAINLIGAPHDIEVAEDDR